MRLLTAEGVREADRRAMENTEIPGILLMENAGMRLTEAVLSLDPLPRKILVLAGPGNNGGDGLVVTRHLQKLGLQVEVCCTAPADKYRGDALANLNILLHSGFPVRHIIEEGDLDYVRGRLARMEADDLVIDALLGTGTSRQVEGRIASLISMINRARTRVMSVDIPSGIHADTGEVLGDAVRADWTVTFAFPKRGLMLFPGADYSGRVVVGEIYIPQEEAPFEGVEVPEGRKVQELLPPRPRDSHKGTFGRALVVAGSPGMTGAAAMAGEAALRGGAGLVYLATAAGLRPVLESKLVEVITLGLPEAYVESHSHGGETGAETHNGNESSQEQGGVISAAGASLVLEWLQECRVLAVGPGMQPGEETYRLLERLLPASPVPVVLDAGALGALSLDPELLRRAASEVVITPHPGEAASLTGMSVAEISQNRLQTARQMSQKWNVIVLLKGAPTVVAHPDGSAWVNPTGGPALASAGTGDLLTGLITALVSQGSGVTEAAVCGAFMHGLAGDLVPPEGRGVKAGDVLLNFPHAFNLVENSWWETGLFGPFNRELRPVVRQG